MRQAVGILMYMSVVSLPNIRLFWKKSMNIAAVSKVMTRDRFEQILSVLHLANNHIQPKKGDPDFDRLFKVRQFLTNLRTHFKQNAETEAVVSVDEQMIPYKGTLGIKVYMKNKPSKWGIKVWGLAGQSGYIHDFNVFGDNLSITEESAAGVGASGQTVLNLVESLEPGTQVFFDNYFASPSLLLRLKELQLPAACTIRANRVEKCPLKNEKELKKEGRGAVDYYLSEDGIFLLRWFDNKEVTVGSNHYGAEPMSMVRRWDKTKKVYVYIRIPALIKAYNKGMGGVDHCDQLLSFYRYTTYLRYIYKYDTGNVQYIYIYIYIFTLYIDEFWVQYQSLETGSTYSIVHICY
jgi:hypothetical protein